MSPEPGVASRGAIEWWCTPPVTGFPGPHSARCTLM
jgi:hypothetical protein